jgi:predicted AAA+ superfamily ATPase
VLDTSYKSLKAVLEGGVEGRPRQCLVLRHLEPSPSNAARDGRQ